MRLWHFSELPVKNNRVNNRFAISICILYRSKVRFEEGISMDELCCGRMIIFLINNSDEG